MPCRLAVVLCTILMIFAVLNESIALNKRRKSHPGHERQYRGPPRNLRMNRQHGQKLDMEKVDFIFGLRPELWDGYQPPSRAESEAWRVNGTVPKRKSIFGYYADPEDKSYEDFKWRYVPGNDAGQFYTGDNLGSGGTPSAGDVSGTGSATTASSSVTVGSSVVAEVTDTSQTQSSPTHTSTATGQPAVIDSEKKNPHSHTTYLQNTAGVTDGFGNQGSNPSQGTATSEPVTITTGIIAKLPDDGNLVTKTTVTSLVTSRNPTQVSSNTNNNDTAGQSPSHSPSSASSKPNIPPAVPGANDPLQTDGNTSPGVNGGGQSHTSNNPIQDMGNAVSSTTEPKKADNIVGNGTADSTISHPQGTPGSSTESSRYTTVIGDYSTTKGSGNSGDLGHTPTVISFTQEPGKGNGDFTQPSTTGPALTEKPGQSGTSNHDSSSDNKPSLSLPSSTESSTRAATTAVPDLPVLRPITDDATERSTRLVRTSSTPPALPNSGNSSQSGLSANENTLTITAAKPTSVTAATTIAVTTLTTETATILTTIIASVTRPGRFSTTAATTSPTTTTAQTTTIQLLGRPMNAGAIGDGTTHPTWIPPNTVAVRPGR